MLKLTKIKALLFVMPLLLCCAVQKKRNCIIQMGNYPSCINEVSNGSERVWFVDICSKDSFVFEWNAEYDGMIQRQTLNNGDLVLSFLTYERNNLSELESVVISKLRFYGKCFGAVEVLPVKIQNSFIEDSVSTFAVAENLLENEKVISHDNETKLSPIARKLMFLTLMNSDKAKRYLAKLKSTYKKNGTNAEILESFKTIERILKNNRIRL